MMCPRALLAHHRQDKKDVQMRHYASLITSPNEVQAFYGRTPEAFAHDVTEEEFRQRIRVRLAEQVA